MSGSSFTEGGGKHPASATQGGKSPVLLGLMAVGPLVNVHPYQGRLEAIFH